MRYIRYDEYLVFYRKFFAGGFPNERFGQAFLNFFYPSREFSDTTLFYEKSIPHCIKIIFEDYIRE